MFSLFICSQGDQYQTCLIQSEQFALRLMGSRLVLGRVNQDDKVVVEKDQVMGVDLLVVDHVITITFLS